MTDQEHAEGLFKVLTTTIGMAVAVVGHVLDQAVSYEEIEKPAAEALLLRVQTVILSVVDKALRGPREPTAELTPV